MGCLKLISDNMAKDINSKEFRPETKLKLKIFRECFREWFPVFLHNIYIEKIYIYDLFAGSGADSEGNHGSPLTLLEEAKGDSNKYCSAAKSNDKQIYFIFNEREKTKRQKKYILLQSNVNSYLASCCDDNNCEKGCVYTTYFYNREFKEGFFDDNTDFQRILQNSRYGKFILLDQYGISQVDTNVFLKLVNSPKTDFIFFISSSTILRFKEHSNIKKYFDTNEIEFDPNKPQECHRILANYFQSLIPLDKEYYLHHFTIESGTNRYGLIFGTAHTLGMEKFLKVCWKYDEFAGEANMNIDGNFNYGELFYQKNNSYKKNAVMAAIRNEVLSGLITDNIQGLKYALKHKCLPVVFTDVIKELEGRYIKRVGSTKYYSNDIHKIRKGDNNYYKIELLKKYENNQD